ncbi:hypothetical protein SLOPH_923 [Spraguea lophii 42_110]|uniref:Uncharacterized protein n=1 Tax=Spraguea lophii (strain 42_110) TaxID=1358809 RepID=S7XSX4_SPRLO|nr:hypothetical protein SLOPH_923 [Spraguea lophii 42_110]
MFNFKVLYISDIKVYIAFPAICYNIWILFKYFFTSFCKNQYSYFGNLKKYFYCIYLYIINPNFFNLFTLYLNLDMTINFYSSVVTFFLQRFSINIKKISIFIYLYVKII